MEKADRDLLIRDLSARLPYGVKVRCAIPFLEEDDYPIEELTRISKDILTVNGSTIRIENVKPYLRPLSSMTSEERKECEKLMEVREARDTGGVDGAKWYVYHDTLASIDFLLSRQFDFRGLIELGLALEAPEGMYKLGPHETI